MNFLLLFATLSAFGLVFAAQVLRPYEATTMLKRSIRTINVRGADAARPLSGDKMMKRAHPRRQWKRRNDKDFDEDSNDSLVIAPSVDAQPDNDKDSYGAPSGTSMESATSNAGTVPSSVGNNTSTPDNAIASVDDDNDDDNDDSDGNDEGNDEDEDDDTSDAYNGSGNSKNSGASTSDDADDDNDDADADADTNDAAGDSNGSHPSVSKVNSTDNGASVETSIDCSGVDGHCVYLHNAFVYIKPVANGGGVHCQKRDAQGRGLGVCRYSNVGKTVAHCLNDEESGVRIAFGAVRSTYAVYGANVSACWTSAHNDSNDPLHGTTMIRGASVSVTCS